MIDRRIATLNATGYATVDIPVDQNIRLISIRAFVLDVGGGYVIKAFKVESKYDNQIGRFTSLNQFQLYPSSTILKGGTKINITCKSIHNAGTLYIYYDYEVLK